MINHQKICSPKWKTYKNRHDSSVLSWYQQSQLRASLTQTNNWFHSSVIITHTTNRFNAKRNKTFYLSNFIYLHMHNIAHISENVPKESVGFNTIATFFAYWTIHRQNSWSFKSRTDQLNYSSPINLNLALTLTTTESVHIIV